MAKPREKPPRPEAAIEDVLLGASRIQALYVAVRLGIPDLVADGPRSSTVLASTTGVHPDALHRLLRFLAVEGYFSLTDDGRFGPNANSEALRLSDEHGLRAAVLSTATRAWEVWGHLLHSVETGRPAFDLVFGASYFAEQAANPDALRAFTAALSPGATECGQALARQLAPAACVADLGCGSAALLVELLRAWPASRGMAVDSSQVLEAARNRLRDEELSARIAWLERDFFAGVPAGASLYLLSLVLHDWDDSRCALLLRNCHAAMAPGARLVIVDRVVPDDPRANPQAIHADLGMLVMTGGRERTMAEFQALLSHAGLRFERAFALATGRDVTAIEATRGLV